MEAIVVFTAKSIERILREGGTSSWRLDRNHARQCTYAVCTRNAYTDWVEGPEAHRSAFLIGRVRDVRPSPPSPENSDVRTNRFLIQLSQFARVNIPDIWKGDRNPVGYRTLEALGIDPSTLDWEDMPEPSETTAAAPKGPSTSMQPSAVMPLSMAEAKKGLALTFNVPPEAIEITIRG
jgi:hypothetical protein